MPWIEVLLRGQKVFAKAKADGAFEADGGRVEIRYKANDGRAYRAAAANLTPMAGGKLLPDDAVGDAEPVAAKASAATKTAKTGGARSAAPAAHAPTATGSATSGRFLAYTDGACSGNPGPAGAGYIVVLPGGKMLEGYEFLGTATNNIAELQAILRALEAMPDDANEIIVHTDSKYAIGVLSKGWKAKVNQELIARTKKVFQARRATLVYVPGHSGVPLNERADELAREAISTRRTRSVDSTKTAPA